MASAVQVVPRAELLPPGGTTGQVLGKHSPANGDAGWQDVAVSPIGAHDRYVTPAVPGTVLTLSYVPSAIFSLTKNGNGLAEGFDFTTNYATGVITLATVPAAGDVFAVSYETNGDVNVIPGVGLVAWWRADQLGQPDASAVSLWTDSTANKWQAVQATGVKQPTFHHTPAGFGGLPAVLFDGADDILDFAYDPKLNPASEFTVYAVVQKSTALGSQRIVVSRHESGAPDGGWNLYGGNGSDNASGGIWATDSEGFNIDVGTLPPTETHVVGVNNTTGGQGTGYRDGVQFATWNRPFYAPNTGDAGHIGGDPNFGAGNLGFNGYIAEVLFWDRALTNAEMLAVGAYFVSKYNI